MSPFAIISVGRGVRTLFAISIDLIRQLNRIKVHLGVSQQLFQGVQLVRFEVKNLFYSGIDQHFEAVDAGCVRYVNGGILDGRTVFRSLGNGVHLGVDGAKAILFGIAIGSF